MSPSAIHWFRKGLRLHDNPAFLSAVSSSHLELRPIFILDPWFVSNCNVGINRWRFLQQSLQDLDTQLRALGSRLFVVRGNPKEVLPRLFKDWQVEKLTFEVDSEPYAVQRDAEVEALAKTHNVEVDTRVSHTLYNLQAVIQVIKQTTP